MKLPLRFAILLPCPDLGGSDGLALTGGGGDDVMGTPFSVSMLPLEPAEVADIVFDRLSPDVFFPGRAGSCGFGRSGMLGTLRSSGGEGAISSLEVVDVEISDSFASAGGTAWTFFSGLGGTLG